MGIPSLPARAMLESQPLLSICIPTFNRAETLRKTLSSFVEDDAFASSADVEIVISDNASTDHTAEVVHSFVERFPGRIQYSKGHCDPADLNFERALRMGRGRFLKLQNDSFGVRTGLLDPWMRILKTLEPTRPVIFLVNESPVRDDEVIRHCVGLDEFLDAVSFRCTWIGGFGIWAEDLAAMPDFSRAADLHLVQTDAVLRMVAAKQRAVVVREFMQPCFASGRKGGYNIAEVFGANYLSILRRYLDDGALSTQAFAVEKKRMLLEHILPFVVSPDHDFIHDDLLHHLRDYSDEPYFLPALKAAVAKGGPPNSQGMPPPPSKETFEQQWRRINSHNETTCSHPIPISKVSVGRRTYGVINAWYWGHAQEHLRIGHFCSIGGGVEFVLGGNHAMDGFSTYPFKVKLLGHVHEALSKGPIVVGDDVWIGNKVTILSGTRIGQGAVIGACAVVSGEIPPYAVVAGNPARVVRYRFSPAVIQELLNLDYGRLHDDRLMAMADRLYEPLHEGNVAAFVQALMGDGSV